MASYFNANTLPKSEDTATTFVLDNGLPVSIWKNGSTGNITISRLDTKEMAYHAASAARSLLAQWEAEDLSFQKVNHGVDVAYIRVSSTDQNTERQLADTSLRFEREFVDKCSGGTTERPALRELLAYVRKGDTVHVHSIDRLARNLENLRDLVNQLIQKGVTIRFHKEGLTFTAGDDNPMSDLLLNMLGAVAQFERAMIKERQREGIAKAQAKGIYTGRKKVIDDELILLELASGLSMRKTAERLGVSLSTVQRAKKTQHNGS